MGLFMKKIIIITSILLILMTLFTFVIPLEYKVTLSFHIGIALIVGFMIGCLLSKTQGGRDLSSRIRGMYLSMVFNSKSHDMLVRERFIYQNPQCITIGSRVTIDHDTEFYPVGKYNGKTFPSKIIIGNNVHIGAYNRFASKELVEIEDDVLFAAYVHITDHSHDYRNVETPIYKQGLIEKGPVKIGKGSWIGLRCSILSGVSIGEHSIIAAGAVVTKDIPPYSIAAGVPAKIVKYYDLGKHEWIAPQKETEELS